MKKQKVFNKLLEKSPPAASHAASDSIESNNDQVSDSINKTPPQFKLSSQKNNVIQKSPESIAKYFGLRAHCQTIYEAISGPGTDEDAIYDALRKSAQFDPQQARLLSITYASMYSSDLVTDLQGDLSGGELAAALIYMGYLSGINDILGSFQWTRARNRMVEMSGSELSTFCFLLSNADSDAERSYILKALAAGHDLFTILIFAYRIKGKDADWLSNHLRLADNTSGRGIVQQWNNSCNVTSAMAVRGEIDPIYSLRIHDENPNLTQNISPNTDPTTINPNMAQDQKDDLESNYNGSLGNMKGGVAVNRGASGGVGRWQDDVLNRNSDASGVTYSTEQDPSVSRILEVLDENLVQGIPVTIVVGNGPGSYGHTVMVRSRTAGGDFRIHDPWSGDTTTVTRAQITNSTFNIAGWNMVTAIDVPSPT